MEKITGQCHCGKVHFEITPPTEFSSHCHCESCRRTHGAAFVTWTSVPDQQLRINRGEELLHKYESTPNIFWISCRNCASPLFQTTRHSPNRTYITVASLTSPLDRKPDSHVSFEEKVDWLQVQDNLPKHRAKASSLLE